MAQMYTYDAFISYRHLPLDEAVASRVQELLERYRPPKGIGSGKKARINRIFRDKTELPTSGDLDHALQNALLSSRYLIIILSEETKHSKWCMEEIRLFKEAHGGSISHILPVLVSGEPNNSIPKLLKFEQRSDPSGNPVLTEVEPLCCDIRAESTKASLKKLKTEFLRLAAPLLDCGFDDLYQRHKRRARQQQLYAAMGSAAAAVVLGIFGYSSYASYRSYQQNLLSTYIHQGAELSGTDVQKALMYFGNALSLDGSSQAAETGALMLLQDNAWLSHVDETEEEAVQVPSMPQCGSLLNAAKDGSCYTYFDGTTVTFWFPNSSAAYQITVPTKVNPACNLDSVLEQKPSAMAVSESRAMIRSGGYLYLYNLEENGESSLFDEFDLALVFKEDAANRNIDLWNEFWADPGGSLAVLYNGASAGVFNIANKDNPCLNAVHTVYGYGLNDVAFSNDHGYYALVYGNGFGITHYDPGGYVEVYDEYGDLCMATPMDANMAPEGAAFSPEGDRLLVWGSSTLQIWDTATGTPAAAPIQLEKITKAAWTEDGAIAVSDGSGTAQIYVPFQFQTDASPESIPAPTEEVDVYAQEIQLASGYWLNHNFSKIWLSDKNRNIVGQEVQVSINKMYAAPDSSVAYFWYDNSDTLVRITVKEDNSGLLSESLNTQGLGIVDLVAVPGGVVAFAENDSMLYYPQESLSPQHTMILGSNGNLKEAAGAKNGLFAVLIQSTEFYSSDSHNFAYRYDLELWDVNTGLCVAHPEAASSKRPQNILLTDDGWLLYEKNNAQYRYLVSISDADTTAARFLSSISCFQAEGDQEARLQTPVFDNGNAGSWGKMLSFNEFTSAAAAPSPADAYIQELDTILQSQGEDAWFARFNEIWNTLTTDELSLGELSDLFRNYLRTAQSLDRIDEIRPGLACITNAFIADAGENWIAQYGFTIQIMQLMQQTQGCDDIIIDYWLRLSDAMEANYDYESEDWFLDFAAVYENRIYAQLLQGDGPNAFFTAIDEVYWDSLAEIIVNGNLDHLFYMVKGQPENAAASQNDYLDQLRELYAYDPAQCREEVQLAIMFALYDYHMLQQRGILSETDVCTFIDALSANVGLELTQVTSRNLSDGLYLGDIVIAVDDIRVFNQFHIPGLMETYPTASLTVLRGSRTFTTEPIENWLISGNFYAE